MSLSGGERRRVEIARALAADPLFILLDEPFAGVDPISVGDIKKIILHLKQRGIGVLITDHNVRETLRCVWACLHCQSWWINRRRWFRTNFGESTSQRCIPRRAIHAIVNSSTAYAGVIT